MDLEQPPRRAGTSSSCALGLEGGHQGRFLLFQRRISSCVQILHLCPIWVHKEESEGGSGGRGERQGKKKKTDLDLVNSK